MNRLPRLVIFDCDGVLVDSERITNQVIRDNLARYGLDIELSRVLDLFVGGTMQTVMDLAKSMGADLPKSWLDEIYDDIFAALSEGCTLIPGVPDVLDALDAAGIPYAVGSNGPHAKMKITLVKTGLMERLAGRIVSREDVVHPKPAPDVYLKAAALLDVKPEHCVVIEDSVSGAKAGRAAGMRCFGFAADTALEKLTPICDAIFTEMRQLPELLGLKE
ncbi:MAG: HAD family phosphatase [Aliishimia sp.]